MALADAYEETTAALVHKQIATHLQAVDMFVKSAGRRFDPILVEAFVTVEAEFDRTRCVLAESEEDHIPSRTTDCAERQGCSSQ